MDHCGRAEFAQGLVRVVALHDEDTATHLQATAALARRIAEQMRLAQTVASTIELGGLLHDIGKMAIGREILRKPAALDVDQWERMRLHAELGATALAGLVPLAALAPVVRAHHERIDGRGYPDRLRGDEIPLEARVVAVADAFHALTTDRPYRRAVFPQAALRVLRDAAGQQFDADVVAAAVDLFVQPRRSRSLSA